MVGYSLAAIYEWIEGQWSWSWDEQFRTIVKKWEKKKTYNCNSADCYATWTNIVFVEINPIQAIRFLF